MQKSDMGSGQQDMGSLQQETGSRQQEMGSPQQEMGGRQQEAGGRRQDTGSRQQQAEMSVGSEARDTFRREAQSAREAMHDARDEVAKKAREYASEAKSAAVDQAESAQRDMGASLVALGGALRAAGDHLEGSNQGAASRMIREAADGVERLAGSLKNRPFTDIVNDVRTFGRENSGMLFAGSLLAGLALGRLVKSSAPHSHQFSHPGKRSSQPGRQSSQPGQQSSQYGHQTEERRAEDSYSEFPEAPAGEHDFPPGRQQTYGGSPNRSSGNE